MAVVNPLFINSDNDLQEMTDAQVVLHRQKAIYQYSLDPSALLTVVSDSGANMAAITDTRLQSGPSATSVSSFQSTSAPSATTDVSFDKINFAYDTSSDQTEDTDNRAFPIYRNSDGNIQAMTLDDMKDTFLHPAIDLMVVADASADDANAAGTYRIHTASSLTDFTEVSGASTPIFTDTTSNASSFTASSIGTAGTTQIGTATTVQSYYLQRRNGTDIDISSIKLASITSNGDIQEYSDGGATLLGNWLKYTAGQSTDGYKIIYLTGASGATSGTQRGTSMLNKQLNSEDTLITQVNTNDYRAQKTPFGSAATVNTMIFTINKT